VFRAREKEVNQTTSYVWYTKKSKDRSEPAVAINLRGTEPSSAVLTRATDWLRSAGRRQLGHSYRSATTGLTLVALLAGT